MPRTVRSLARVATVAAAFTLLGAGCISFSKSTAGADGGLYRSANKGDDWTHPTALPTARGVGSIGGVDVVSIAFDVQDPKAIYLGTGGNGLFYSYDSGTSWTQAKAIASGKVPAVAVHPKNKCIIFAAIDHRVLKSTDCNRTFQPVYTDTRPAARVTSLIIDWYNPRTMYFGTNEGDLLRSMDEGNSWAPLKRFDDAIVRLAMSSKDSRVLLVGLKTIGLYRTVDAGASWAEIRKAFDDFSSARTFYDLAEVRTEPNTYLHASRFGLLKTADNGDTWSKIDILTPPGATTIYALATNPKNGREIYYATANTMYRSLDGGATWTPKKLPTTRAGTALAVDPSDGSVIYVGGTTLKK